MFIDKNLMFFDDEVITSTGDYDSDVLPLATAADMDREGRGEGMEIVVQITSVDFTSGGAPTFDIELVTSDDASFSNVVKQYEIVAIPLTDMTQGKKFYLPVRTQGKADADGAYLGVRVSVNTAAVTGSPNKTISSWMQRVGEDQASFN